MDPSAAVDRPLSTTPRESSLPAELVRFLYTNNPFYAISSALVMFGLYQSFEGQVLVTHPWHLLNLLGGYTVLLAVTAFLVIRFCKLWDDGRMVLLLVVLLLLALGVSFDSVLLQNPDSGDAVILTALALAIGISEALLHGLRIRLPLGYRTPYYLLLVLFYLYPLWLVRAHWMANEDAIRWGVFLYGPACGLGFLSLLPAVRRGPDYVPRTTPWNWPLFPWTLFAFLGFGFCARSWYLTISFVPALNLDSPWGLYFLVPILFAWLILAFEWSLRAKNEAAAHLLLFVPLFLLWCCFPATQASPAYSTFVGVLTEFVGAPLYLALLGVILFYTYAVCRKVSAAQFGLIAALVAATFVGPRGFDPSLLQTWPMALAAVWAVWRAWQLPSAWREFVAVVFTIAFAAIFFRGTWFTASFGFLVWHLLAAAGLIFGMRYQDDEFLSALRGLIALAIIGWAPLASTWAEALFPSPLVVVLYLLTLLVVAGLVAYRFASVLYCIATSTAAIAAMVVVLQPTYVLLSATVVGRGLRLLTGGVICFVLAAVISLAKSGAFRGLRRAWAEHRERVLRGATSSVH